VSAGSWINSIPRKEFAGSFKVYRQALYWFDIKDSLELFFPADFRFSSGCLAGIRTISFYGPAIDGVRGGVKVASEQHAFNQSRNC